MPELKYIHPVNMENGLENGLSELRITISITESSIITLDYTSLFGISGWVQKVLKVFEGDLWYIWSRTRVPLNCNHERLNDQTFLALQSFHLYKPDPDPVWQ